MKKPIMVCLLAACAAFTPAIGAKDSGKSAFGTAFQDLAGDDQARFVSTVNLSMAKQDEPLDEKSIITLYRVNRDAVKASPPIDRKKVLAAVFATAPKECLPYFTDHLAEDLFTRKAAGFNPDDDSFMEFASAALLRISRVLHVMQPRELPGMRSAFAVIMFIKASEGKPDDLREVFMLYVLSGSHEITRKKWFPAVFGDDNQVPTYKPMLEAMEKGEEPDHKLPLPIASPQLSVWMRGEMNLDGNTADDSGPTPADSIHVKVSGVGMDMGLSRVPRAAVSDKDSPYYTRRRGRHPDRPEPPEGEEEPCGYVGQTF